MGCLVLIAALGCFGLGSVAQAIYCCDPNSLEIPGKIPIGLCGGGLAELYARCQIVVFLNRYAQIGLLNTPFGPVPGRAVPGIVGAGNQSAVRAAPDNFAELITGIGKLLKIILVFDEARCHIGNDLAGKTLEPPPFCMGSRPFIAVPFLVYTPLPCILLHLTDHAHGCLKIPPAMGAVGRIGAGRMDALGKGSVFDFYKIITAPAPSGNTPYQIPPGSGAFVQLPFVLMAYNQIGQAIPVKIRNQGMMSVDAGGISARINRFEAWITLAVKSRQQYPPVPDPSFLMGKYDVGHTVFIPVNGIGGLRIIVPICRIGKQPENSATACLRQ